MISQVHFKNRDYQCGLCFSTFARKDTLQRYVPFSFEIFSHLVGTDG